MKNPLLAKTHDIETEEIHAAFKELAVEANSNALSLHKYLRSRPERFYSRQAYQVFLRAMTQINRFHRKRLVHYIKEHETEINNAFRHAQEINALDWHDRELKGGNDYHSLILIDREIHPAYLRLVEGVFLPMLRVVAFFSRVDANKGTQGLNLHNVVSELPDTEFADIKSPYRHLMRNGIAHGGVRYFGDEIVYKDSRSNEVALKKRDVVRTFDDMLDVCNGLLLAYSVFSFSRPSDDFGVPQNLMVEELCAETKTPYWEVVGALPSTILNNQDQLIIYCTVQTTDEDKVRFSAVQTAILAERVAPGYDRYFVSMKGKNGLPGMASFDGTKLGTHRIAGHPIEAYSDVTIEYLPMFLAFKKRIRVPRKLNTLRYATLVNGPLIMREYRKQLGKPNITVRNSSIHMGSRGTVLNADVVVETRDQTLDQNMVRNCARAILRRARKAARRRQNWFSPTRYVPFEFAQINVFCVDYRSRRLSGFGLGEDLIGTIRLQRFGKINPPNILGSTIEIWRGLRFAWNRSWLENQEENTQPGPAE